MEIGFSSNFRKQYKKANAKIKTAFNIRLKLFKDDPYSLVLNNHPLKGKYLGYRSINVTGDLRAVFKREANLVIFVAIDSHSNLYG